MRKVLRVWVALAIGAYLNLPTVQAQVVTPTGTLPAVIPSISDLQPPSFRQQPPVLMRVQAVTTSVVGNGVAGRPAAAPTVGNQTVTVAANTSIFYIADLNVTNTGGSALTAYRFFTVPDPAIVELYAFNSGTRALRQITTVPDEVLLSQYDQIVFRVVNNTTTTTSFQWRARNANNELSNASATYTINIQQVPNASPQVSQIVPAGAPATPLTVPLTVEPGSIAATDYVITSLPTAAQGVLALNGTAVTANQIITPAQASQLTFDPVAGFFGTAVFNYYARNANGLNGPTVSYGIPVAKTVCGQASTLNFANLTDGQDFQTTQSVLIEGVTITASNYTAPSSQTTFRIEDNPSLPGKSLAWTADYTSSSNAASFVDFTFSRALDNFSLALSDIDQVDNVWRDQVQFTGYTASGQVITLSASDVALAPNNSNAFSSPNTVTGQGNSNNFGPNSNVVVTFPQAIVRLRLTYRNTEPIADPGGQLIGINSMSWCSVVDVYTRFTAGPVAANVGDNVSYTVEYGNNGPDAAQQVTRTVTLPAGATNVTIPNGATYNSTTRVIDFGTAASVASGNPTSFTFSFLVPGSAGSYNVVSNTSTPGNENGATANNTATRTLVVNDCNSSNLLNYTAPATTTGSRKTGNDAVGATTVTYSNFTSTVPPGQTNEFNVDNFTVNGNPILTSKTLAWYQNYTNLATLNRSTVTLSFPQPVNSLTLVIDDIDASTRAVAGSDFIDVLQLDGYATNTSITPATLTAANFIPGATNSFTGSNSLTGNANAVASQTDDDATIRFTTPVQRLVLTYTNTQNYTAGNTRLQAIGIKSISYCNQPLADLQTTITTAASPINAGSTGQFNVTFLNNGPSAAPNVARQVQLPAGLIGVNVTGGGTYNSSTGIVTYPVTASLASGANLNSTITFTAPAAGGSVTASSVISGDVNENGTTANNSASATINVTPVADVTTVINGPTSLTAGQTGATYSVTFSNNGPSQATNVARTVTLPAGVTNVVVPNGATYNAGTRVIDFGTAAGISSGTGTTFQFSFTAPTTPGTASVVSNTSTATSQGGNAAPDQFTLNLDVQAVADVAVSISAQSATVNAGAQGQFSVIFTNNGPNTATNVTRTVQLPAGLTGVTLPDGGTYDATTGVVTFPALTSLASSTSNSFRIQFTAPATGASVTASAAISTPDNEQGNTANNSASATIGITPVFDVLTRISGPTSTVAGTLTTFNVVTLNNGPSVATGVVQTVQLPTGLSGVFVTNGGTYNSANGVVTFPSVAALPTGTVLNNSVSFLAPAAGFTASASVSPTSGDTNTANNTAAGTATTVTAAPAGSANLYTTISAPSATVAPNGSVTFTVDQGNSGKDAATNVITRVSLPAGLTGVTVSNGTYDPTTGVVTFNTIASQAAGSAVSYTITMAAPASGALMAVANVTSGTTDPMTANNVSATKVQVNPVTDVATTLTGPTTATTGQQVTYTLQTSNTGTLAATNVQQTVQLAAGLTGVTVSGGGIYNSATGVVTFPAIATQQPGASVSNTISYTVPAGGTLNNVASVSTTTPETTITNNRSAATTTVTTVADLSVSLVGPTAAVAGNPVTYSVTTTNNGPSAATNAVTTVQLPTGLTGVTVSGGGTYSSTTGVVTFPTVASQPAGSVTNTISFVAPSASQLTLTANAAADNEEVTTNNSASATTTLSSPTATVVDVQTTVSASNTSPTSGQAVTFTVTTTNSSGSAAAATNVQQLLYLPAGLTGVTVPTGATYDATTGVVTFPVITSQAPGAAATYTVTANAPASGSFTATASVSADQSETNTANNTAGSTVTVDARADVVTTITGPASTVPGASVTYNVVSQNNGPASAASVIQTVQLPAGLTGVTVSGGGNYNSNSGLVTFPTITSLAPGTANAITNTISFTAPSAGYSAVASISTTTTETNTANSSTQSTSIANQPPTANSIVDAQRTPLGNTAGQMALAPLSGRDADGTLASFTITSLPPAGQGVLYYNGSPVTQGQSIPAADANKLFFDPAAGFVGNVFFTYTTTDNLGAASADALYTVAVGQDINSVYTNSPAKGGTTANSYQNNDPIATVFDVNGGAYNTAGTITSNGLTNATTDAAGTTQLSSLGLTLNSTTGLISVQDRTKLKAGSYTVQVTTVDAYGGTNTQPVTFTIGVAPLPVTLLNFSAKAVSTDAQLNWATAQEINNSHFVVERSLDGRQFETVGRKQGQGTISTATTYTFVDAGIGRQANGLVYYRLRQVDTDGTSSLSSVQTVRFSKNLQAEVTVYPNPASGQAEAFLDLAEVPVGTYTITVTDMAGRVVRTLPTTGATQQALGTADLPKGSYIVTLRGGGQVINRPFTKVD